MNLAKALEIAYNAHEGQTDKAGASYILHCLRVAKSMSTDEEKIVALLHDVVEDTDMTHEELYRNGFSPSVLDAVYAITRQADESYNSYMKRVAANDLAYTVKVADMWDNSNVSRFAVDVQNENEQNCANYLVKRNKLIALRAKFLRETKV
jgi:(p)ppGpp synthase/HD superfamily hydrolase